MSKRIKGKNIKGQLDEIDSKTSPTPRNTSEIYLKTKGNFVNLYDDAYTQNFSFYGETLSNTSYFTNSDPIIDLHEDPLFSGSIVAYWDFQNSFIRGVPTGSLPSSVVSAFNIDSTDASKTVLTSTFENEILDGDGGSDLLTDFGRHYGNRFLDWAPNTEQKKDTRAILSSWKDSRSSSISGVQTGYVDENGLEYGRYQARHWVSGSQAQVFNFSDGFNDQPFSISCWVRIIDFQDTATIIQKGNSGFSEERVWSLSINSQAVGFIFGDGFNFSIREIVGFANVRDFTHWTHICATYNPNVDPFEVFGRIYVNGVDVTSDNNTYGFFESHRGTNSNLIVGNAYSEIVPVTRNSVFYIGELAVFDRVLTEVETVQIAGRKGAVAMPIAMNSSYIGIEKSERTGLSVTTNSSIGLQKSNIDFSNVKRSVMSSELNSSGFFNYADEENVSVLFDDQIKSEPFSEDFIPGDIINSGDGIKLASKDYIEYSFNIAAESEITPGNHYIHSDDLTFSNINGENQIFSFFQIDRTILSNIEDFSIKKGRLLFSAPQTGLLDKVPTYGPRRLFKPWFKETSSVYNVLGVYVPFLIDEKDDFISGSAAVLQYDDLLNECEGGSTATLKHVGVGFLTSQEAAITQPCDNEITYQDFFTRQNSKNEELGTPLRINHTIVLDDLQNDFVLDSANISLSIIANQDWLNDITVYQNGYIGGTSIPQDSWGGPAVTAFLFRLDNEDNYDVICTGTIVPYKDAFYKGVTFSSGTLPNGFTQSQVSKSGFSNYGTPACIVGPHPEKRFVVDGGEAGTFFFKTAEDVLAFLPETDIDSLEQVDFAPTINEFTGSIEVNMIAAQTSAFYWKRLPLDDVSETRAGGDKSFPEIAYAQPQAASPTGRRFMGGDSQRSFNGGENYFDGQMHLTGGKYTTYTKAWDPTSNSQELVFSDIQDPSIDNGVRIKIDNKFSPYILKPGDRLAIGFSKGQAANIFEHGFGPEFATNAEFYSSTLKANHIFKIDEGQFKIRLFGSYVQDRKAKTNGRTFLNLSSNSFEEVIVGDTEILDQYDIQQRSELGREYVNRYITGNLDLSPGSRFDIYVTDDELSSNPLYPGYGKFNQRTRGLVSLHSNEDRFYPVKAFRDSEPDDTLDMKKRIRKKTYVRGVALRNNELRDYDTMLPSYNDICGKYGERIPTNTGFIPGIAALNFLPGAQNRPWLSQFPFETGENGKSLFGKRNVTIMNRAQVFQNGIKTFDQYLGLAAGFFLFEGPIPGDNPQLIATFAKGEEAADITYGFNTPHSSLVSAITGSLFQAGNESNYLKEVYSSINFINNPPAGFTAEDENFDVNDIFLRGYKYGVSHTRDMGPTYILNRKHHGHLRDMFEQGHNTAFYQLSGPGRGTIAYPIETKNTDPVVQQVTNGFGNGRETGFFVSNNDPNLAQVVPFFDDGVTRGFGFYPSENNVPLR